MASPAGAQTDEIQVYTADIAAPGQVTLTFHDNYAAIGRSSPDFPGGVVPDRALNGVTELALGLTPWWELGAYAPIVYTLDRRGHFFVDGAKLRTLFVTPHATERLLFYGCNLELSYNRPQWASTTWQLEVRPILGVHLGRWELAVNPIVDLALASGGGLDLAPATRALFRLDAVFGAGLELYQDLGPPDHLLPLARQQQTLFAVVDVSAKALALELGVGHGFTAGSDPLIFKLIVTPSF